MSPPLSGTCLCGAVTLTVASPVLAARQCWCRTCQSIACGNASNNVIIAKAGLQVQGALSEHRSIADSGARIVRSFCPQCGTHVLAADEDQALYVVVRAGVLTDKALAAPQSVIWTGSAPAWASIDPSLPAVAGQPALAAAISNS